MSVAQQDSLSLVLLNDCLIAEADLLVRSLPQFYLGKVYQEGFESITRSYDHKASCGGTACFSKRQASTGRLAPPGASRFWERELHPPTESCYGSMRDQMPVTVRANPCPSV